MLFSIIFYEKIFCQNVMVCWSTYEIYIETFLSLSGHKHETQTAIKHWNACHFGFQLDFLPVTAKFYFYLTTVFKDYSLHNGAIIEIFMKYSSFIIMLKSIVRIPIQFRILSFFARPLKNINFQDCNFGDSKVLVNIFIKNPLFST